MNNKTFKIGDIVKIKNELNQVLQLWYSYNGIGFVRVQNIITKKTIIFEINKL